MSNELTILKDSGEAIELWESSNPVEAEGCDTVIGFDLYDATGELLDGGEIDCKYETIEEAGIVGILDDILDFANEVCPDAKFDKNNITFSFGLN